MGTLVLANNILDTPFIEAGVCTEVAANIKTF
jgi:hypothetical protein